MTSALAPAPSDRPLSAARAGDGSQPVSSGISAPADASRRAAAPSDSPDAAVAARHREAAAAGESSPALSRSPLLARASLAPAPDSPEAASGAPAAPDSPESASGAPAAASAPEAAADAPAPSDSSGDADEPDPEDRSARAIEGPADAATFETEATAAPEVRPPSAKPPRVDGTYLGITLGPGVSFARVNDFPTPNPFVGGGGTFRVGEVVYPWLSVGIEIAGNLGYRAAEPRQRVLQGAFLVDFGFYPAPKKLPLSLRAGFGAGGGAVRERGREDRSGFGGAVFTTAVRYEFFPGAARRRPNRGGGFSIGPEAGWIGFMPAAKGRPMSNTVYVGVFLGFYFGS